MCIFINQSLSLTFIADQASILESMKEVIVIANHSRRGRGRGRRAHLYRFVGISDSFFKLIHLTARCSSNTNVSQLLIYMPLFISTHISICSGTEAEAAEEAAGHSNNEP